MNDAAGGLAMIFAIIALIVIVIGALLSVGVFILGGILIVGAISGVVVGIQNFSEVFEEAHKKLPFNFSVYVMEFYKNYYVNQPANLLYPFGGGWQVMKYVKDTVFKRTETAANYWKGKGGTYKTKSDYESNALFKYYYWSAYAGFELAGLSQYLTALIIVALFCALQFVILVCWMVLATILMGFLAGINFLNGYYYKIFFRCPDCHEQMSIPVYICPNCASEHTRLWPSVYGIFYHTCSKCDTKLPTLDYLGRKELVQKCAVCKHPMNKAIGRQINVHIPVIGGPNSGKSSYIFMATNQFIEKYARPRGMDVMFPDEKHNQTYESNLKLLSSGSPLLKTTDIVPQAYNLSVKKPKDSIGHIIYIYDAAGEAYTTEINTVQQQPYFHYIHGFVFIIDPFSIEYFYREHENEISKIKSAIRPSSLNVMDAYERMITVLESSFGVKRGEKFKHPVAVVISKTDALGLEEKVGRVAAQVLMAKDSSIKNETDAIHILTEQFLIDNQLGNFVRDIHLQFENVRFFSCSALGRLPDPSDRRGYEPVGVLDPFIWLLGEVGTINLIQERSLLVDQENKAMASGSLFQKAKYYFWDSLIPRE